MRSNRFRQYAGGSTGSPRKARSDGAITRATCAMSSSIVMQKPRKTSLFSFGLALWARLGENEWVVSAQAASPMVRKLNRSVKLYDDNLCGQCVEFPFI
jgi:hypothetical protein